MKPCKRCGGSGREPAPHEIGKLIYKRRAALGLSMREVARRCGVTVAYLSLLELGRSEGRGPKARKVAKFLEAP